MKRWWIVIALLLSVGLNLGLLAQRARAEKREKASLEALRLEAEKGPEAPNERAGKEPAADAPEANPPAAPATAGEDRPERRPRDPRKRSEPGEDQDPQKPRFLVRLLDRMADDVGVQGQQRQEFIAIHEKFFARTLDLRETQHRRQAALRENLMSPQPDRQLADRQLQELAESQRELEQAFIDSFFDANALLDPGQKARYRRIVAELRRLRWDRPGQDRGGEGFGRGRGRGDRRERGDNEERPRWQKRRDGTGPGPGPADDGS